MNFTLDPTLVHSLVLIVLYALVFLFARYVRSWFSTFKIGHQLVHEDNSAFAISIAGYFIGITAVFVGASRGATQGLLHDIMLVSAYSLAGIVAMNLARIVNDRIILEQFSNTHEIIQQRNIAAGIVQGAYYIASGLIVAGAVSGESGGPLSAFVFFVVGQLILIIFSRIYISIVGYSVHDELKTQNVPVALSFSGNLIAMSLIIMRAIAGTFVGWGESFLYLVLDLALIVLYLVLVRQYFDRLIIPGSKLRKELIEDRNLGAGALEMFVAICFGLVIVFLF